MRNNLEILLNKVIPKPLLETNTSYSEVWNKELKFQAGDLYIISAPSGKGKTTLASLIFGLRKDYTGDIFINNSNIKNINEKEYQLIRRDKISMVFQGLNLINNLSAMENIELKNNLTNKKTTDEILEMSAYLEVDNQLNKTINTLSFGQKQRIAIIRSLCQDFSFIILDEAFSHLDKINTEKAWNLINREAKAKNAGIIINTLQNFEFENNAEKIKL